MKNKTFIIFISVLLSFYGLVNYYIFIRGMEAFGYYHVLSVIYTFLFIFLAASYIAGRLLEKIGLKISGVFIWIGSFWIGMMIYFFLAVLCADIIGFLNHFFGFIPSFMNSSKNKALLAGAVISVNLLIIIAGHFISKNPAIKRIEIYIDKFCGDLKSFKAVFVSDIHLGALINNSRLNKLVSQIRECSPHIVLLGGDIIDEDMMPVIEKNLGETLRNIKSPWGTFAVTGNHEYIGGVDAACRYLSEHGIRVLRDEVVKIGPFYLAGREDRSVKYFLNRERKHLDEILADVEPGCPVILMDHQPFRYRSPFLDSVDLYLSGHTHNGQFWPVNYITKAIFELSWGLKAIGNSQLYVSCGYGTWGPPVRIGNRPELVLFEIIFKSGA